VRYCGAVSGRDQNKLTATGLHEEGPHFVRPVLIEECIAQLECSVVEMVAPGDHTFFIAEVVYAQAEAEAFDAIYLLKERDLRPLHHLGGESYSMLDELLTNTAPPPPEERRR
jgi:flavin reductase (DIM6/NTAB) family NADH-FMN oxidoreductase RutF